MQRKPNGFTLIELMIVVAIIGILSSIAIPAYKNYVIRGKVPDATAALSSKRAELEQYFQDHLTYIGATACNRDTTTGKYFDFICTASSATGYTLQATGKSGTPMSGFTYTVNESNAKTTTIGGVSGWTGSTSCWITKQGGGC